MANKKPRFTTTKKRHGAGERLAKRLADQTRLTHELRQELAGWGL